MSVTEAVCDSESDMSNNAGDSDGNHCLFPCQQKTSMQILSTYFPSDCQTFTSANT